MPKVPAGVLPKSRYKLPDLRVVNLRRSATEAQLGFDCEREFKFGVEFQFSVEFEFEVGFFGAPTVLGVYSGEPFFTWNES